MKGSGFVQTLVRTLIAVVGAGLPLSIDVILAQGLGGAARERHLQEHSRFETQFRSGDTNAPLLAMDWFSEHGVYFCRVTQGGSIYSARDVGHAIQGGSGISSRFSLGNTN